jgi:anaerobic magnesium-protoporphyrin IX monomethyl ester cyclase
MTHEDPDVAWFDAGLKARVRDFELVLKSRFPSVHDRRTSTLGKQLGRVIAHRRWSRGQFENPRLLRTVRQWSQSSPDDRQAYGHLRPASPALRA